MSSEDIKNTGEENPHKGPESRTYKPGYGVFLWLLLITAGGVLLSAFIFWYVPSVGYGSIHPWLPYVAGFVVLSVTGFIVIGAFAITLSLITSGKGGGALSSRFRGLLIKFFLPLMVMMGGVLRIPRIKIEKAFIEINNRMVRQMVQEMARRGKRLAPDKIVILMPHCIQYDDCKLKVTREVRNCIGCGKCEVGELVELAEKYEMELFILTGGTVARRKLEEFRPKAVVAVACERDLTSGIQDAFPLPVMAVVNKRPHGYCVDTGVAIEEIKDAVEDLLARA
ncbi:MAG: DUF116 domain-containing protein [Deltaproteobacteria bacterium]|nr:DUF116 domain-containing protein [Deltaproteobacteria bacterium]